jgi:hypothetical protein
MDFLDLVESIAVESAYRESTFGNEGTNITAHSRRSQGNPTYLRRLTETAKFMAGVYGGRIPVHRLREAMSTSDFPLLFGDVLDRQTLGAYTDYAPTYRNYVRIGTVPDFRVVSRFTLDGAESTLAQVHELEEYKAAKVTAARYQYQVAKYGRRMPFSWETILNDDLGVLQDAPNRFARAARRSEERFATALFVSSSGPNSTFFSNANKNIVNTTNGAASDNPALSITGLQDAFTVLYRQLDTDSEPILIEAVELVVPPTLLVTAQNILNATEIIVGADSAPQRLLTGNWMRNKVRLSVNPYANVINTTNGATAWYLFASPSAGRPAMEVGFLRGYEQPQLFMKSPNAVRVGSGTVDPMQGDFDNDSIDYKIRHVFGGTLIDPKMGVASNGTGS